MIDTWTGERIDVSWPVPWVDVAGGTVAVANTETAPLTPDHARAREQLVYDQGYSAGYADGIAAARPDKPLFEQAKAFALDHPDLPEQRILEEIRALEADGETTLRRADIDLILGQRRRLNVVRKGHAEAQGTIGKPKTPLPSSSARSVTEYDHVS